MLDGLDGLFAEKRSSLGTADSKRACSGFDAIPENEGRSGQLIKDFLSGFMKKEQLT
jgi:hypothetical protein